MISPAARARIHTNALGVAAVCLGAAVPLLFAGRAGEAVALVAAGVAGAVAWLAAPPGRRPSPIVRFWAPSREPAAFAVAVLFVLWAVSAVGSIDPARSPLAWLQTVGLILGAVLMCRILGTDEPARGHAYRTLVLAALAGVVLALVALYLWPSLVGYLREGRPVAPDRARGLLKAYGSALACLAPAVAWAGMRLGGRWRVAGWLFVVPAIAVVHAVGSRAGFLGLGVAALALGLLWLLVRLPRRASHLLAGLIVLVGLAGTLMVANRLPAPPYRGPEQLRLPTWMVDEHRQVIWGFAVARGAERPWFGYGLKTGGRVPGAKAKIPGVGSEYIPSHPHNWIFQLFLETGVLGLLGAAAALFLFLRELVRAAARGQGGAWAAFAVAGAFFGSVLANFSIWQAWWQALYVALTALLLASARGGTAAEGAGERVPTSGAQVR